jgi:transcriptional regulator with XRE-family HTH domain
LTADIRERFETVGQRLRRLRLERGLSQRDLSSPGVSYAYISRIEAGARRPSVKALRMLARKLGVSAEYLETGSEITDAELRQLQLADAELRLRLDNEALPLDDVQEILEEADAQGDAVAATRARIALGFAAARAGHNHEAIEHLEQSLSSELVDPVSRPDVFATLGRAYADSGDARKAVELFQRGLAEVTETYPDDYAAQVRFATYLSYALTDLGDVDGALAVLQDAVGRGEHVADPYTRIRLYWSLGRVSHEQSKPLVALEHFRRAVALLEATEDALHLARAHLSAAAAAVIADAVGEADQHIETAERLLGPRPEPGDVAALRRLQSLVAARRNDPALAAGRAREAVEAATESPNQRGRALSALAASLALTDDTGADAAYHDAVELLLDHGTPRERATVVRDYARYLREHGRDGDALDLLERATEPSLVDR